MRFWMMGVAIWTQFSGVAAPWEMGPGCRPSSSYSTPAHGWR